MTGFFGLVMYETPTGCLRRVKHYFERMSPYEGTPQACGEAIWERALPCDSSFSKAECHTGGNHEPTTEPCFIPS